MILQKSCHDMDILTWLLGKRCKAVSSFGGTQLFKAARAPDGAALRRLDGCKAKENCPFDAEKIYITSPKTGRAKGDSWITSVLSVENTVESTYKALREGPYGRCVYHCDNDVVDHQQTNLPDVYAVGDCAMVHNRITGKGQWSAMGSTANITGRCLAKNLTGTDAPYGGCMGTGVVKLAADLTGRRPGRT